MRDMDLEKWKARKRELGYSFAQLSELSGVPVGTIQKIFSGETRQPRYATIQALEGILKPPVRYSEIAAKAQEESCVMEEALAYGTKRPEDDCVREAAAVYGAKKQGEYTLEDYFALPDDQRVELIDGVIYDMAAPTLLHQRLGGEIHRQIANYIMEKKGPCVPFIAPVDVQLDRDNKTMVQPDVGILCDWDKHRNGRIFGAPDFLVEVISPSTKRKDMTLKLYKYQNAGVREYWMIDLYRQAILTYFFEAEDYPVIYGFRDCIPIRIYGGALKIDMSTMLPWIEEAARDGFD